MDLLNLAERIAALGISPIRLTADRCLHARNKFSSCDTCVFACPIGALKLNGSIALNADLCTSCGQCLHVCPTGAFEGDDGVIDLLNYVARLEGADTIELACSQHPAPEKGSSDVTAVIRTKTCLAALGPSAYLGLVSLEVKRITLRLDACSTCPLGKVRTEIGNTLTTVRRISAMIGIEDRIVELNTVTDRKVRSVYETKNPPVSRRDLFRAFVAKAPRQIEQVLTDNDDQAVVVKSPSRERRRLVNVLKHFSITNTAVSFSELSFARFTAETNCSACGICARICPTGALNFVSGEDSQYQLTFSSRACIDCGACLDVCQTGALQRTAATLADVLADQSVVLRAGTLRSCAKCGAKFAAESSNDLCFMCDFRRTNPTGRYIPPGLQKRLAAWKKRATAAQAAI
jgi:ferredoxin